uniref:Putative ATPase domain containing protein n=1 Tax=viral metagenome TaxID=1070528 RepID=A0A6M3KMN1_9ZZZZ
MTKVISVVNQKGGVGKSTVATNVASYLHLHDGPAMLVDLDPQGSAADWGDTREGENLMPIIKMGKSVARDLPQISAGYKWVVIDGAPQVSELAAAAIRAADVVLIPVQPSCYDIWASSDVVDLVKARQDVTGGKPAAAMMVSRAIKNTHLSRDVKEALQGFELPVLKAITTQRIAYAALVGEGKSVLSLGVDDPALFEIKMLAKEIQELANEI